MGRTAQTIRKYDWNTDMAVLVWHPHKDRCSGFFSNNERTPCALQVLYFGGKISVFGNMHKEGKKFRKETLNRPLFLKG